MLKGILAISGKPGLFKLITQGNNMLIVESLLDGKRMPTYARDRVVSLADVSMFTTEDDVPLGQVLESLRNVCESKVCALDYKKADNDQLREFFAEVLPNFDRDRVYPSDIRKLLSWYNIMIEAGINDFSDAEEQSEQQEDAKPSVSASPKAEAVRNDSVSAAANRNAAPKASSKAAAPRAKNTAASKKG